MFRSWRLLRALDIAGPEVAVVDLETSLRSRHSKDISLKGSNDRLLVELSALLWLNIPVPTSVSIEQCRRLGDTVKMQGLVSGVGANDHITVLSLNSYGVTREESGLLAKHISNKTSLIVLNLSNNDIGASGATALATSLG